MVRDLPGAADGVVSALLVVVDEDADESHRDLARGHAHVAPAVTQHLLDAARLFVAAGEEAVEVLLGRHVDLVGAKEPHDAKHAEDCAGPPRQQLQHEAEAEHVAELSDVVEELLELGLRYIREGFLQLRQRAGKVREGVALAVDDGHVVVDVHLGPLHAAVGKLVKQETVAGTAMHLADVVDAGIEFEALFLESVQAPTRLVVLFEDQHTLSRLAEEHGGRETTDAAADNDCVPFLLLETQLVAHRVLEQCHARLEVGWRGHGGAARVLLVRVLIAAHEGPNGRQCQKHEADKPKNDAHNDEYHVVFCV
eukprot:PhM_4_TR14803/c0_g1_i1/m.13112